MTTTTEKQLTELSAEWAETHDRYQEARHRNTEHLDLLAELEGIGRRVEQVHQDERNAKFNEFASEVAEASNRTYRPLVDALKTLDTAAATVLTRTAQHSAGVGALKDTAQLLAANAESERVAVSRFGLVVDGKRVEFSADSVAGALSRSLEPVFRRLGYASIADSFQAISLSAGPLPAPLTEDEHKKDQS